MRRLDLLEVLSLLDEVLDDIFDDDHHVAVVHNIHLLAEPPVTRDHVRSDTLIDKRNRRDGQLDQLIQGVDLSLDAPAVRNIDDRKSGSVQDVPGDHDIGAAENAKLSAPLWAAGWY